MALTNVPPIPARVRWDRRHARPLSVQLGDRQLIVRGLEESIDHDQPNFGGFHIFTFNQLADTEGWRLRHVAETPAP